MIRLFHVSDIHFGAQDQAALDWFAATVHAEQPDAVVMTGDLTMRARSHEFEAAAKWLEGLKRPVTVEVGNHDLPYFNPWARLVTPYKRYKALERMIERPLDIKGVSIVPMKTTARFQLRLNWSKGYVGGRALRRTLDGIAAAPKGNLILIAAHHPLVDAGTRSTAQTRNGATALAALAQAGAHGVLSGHVHDPFEVAHPAPGGTIRLIGAGTLSERVRDTRPSFNEIQIEDGARFASVVRVMD
ncbi:metallophosphoesterase family protein [Sphingomonas turrisvirgatae]|uniref:Metallophosphoesterase n=1 Tax=Sphingomonas turrisvirgatae TaxID=1888892 RepID=A0A1E3LXS8_9SPHN|nr:metallophosphoesterase [Sphingomonas turrisvirgatae]ODP37925.1 metallophosphoesterase [Sphingomonas turrisvirgatae]